MVTRSTARTTCLRFRHGRFLRLVGAAAFALLQSCVSPQQPASLGTWPGTWPPVSALCPRNNGISFYSIGGELTSLHAASHCVPQPTCRGWINTEHRQLGGPDSGSAWMGLTNHIFSILDQDSIVNTARASAIAHTPAGKRFYRLKFEQAVIVATGPDSGVVQATAYYGQCISDVTQPHNPNPSHQ